MSKTHRIAVIAGDGTGPEVVAEAIKVMNAVAPLEGFALDFVHFDIGGGRYLRTGEVLPDSVLEELKTFDSIFLGAVGTPDVPPGVLEKGLLLKIRFELDQYINLRPVKLYPGVESPIVGKGAKEIDYVVVRENTGGLYCGAGGTTLKDTPYEAATETMLYTRGQVDRCLKWAYDYTRKRNRNKKLALCGKTNVLTSVYGLWDRAFNAMGEADYTDIEREYYHVDALCMYQVMCPEKFDVVVTGNMFGDIITDLGAITQGGLGIAGGGNINPEGVSMFEPIGGSAPQFTGQGVINPLAAICAAGMMLESLGEEAAASRIDAAVSNACLNKVKGMNVGEMGCTTSEVGDFVASSL